MQSEIDGTGLKVNPIGLGAMPLSIAGRPDEIEALAVIEAFVRSVEISSTRPMYIVLMMLISVITNACLIGRSEGLASVMR